MTKTPPPPNPDDFLGKDEDFFVEDEELHKILEEQKKPQAEKKSVPSAKKETGSTPQKPAPPSPTTDTPEPPLKTIATPPPTPLEEPQLEGVKGLPLSLGVELAHFSVPLQEVLKWEPGYELSLQTPISSQVNLTLNGKVVARGELLQIGEQFGVRILDPLHDE